MGIFAHGLHGLALHAALRAFSSSLKGHCQPSWAPLSGLCTQPQRGCCALQLRTGASLALPASHLESSPATTHLLPVDLPPLGTHPEVSFSACPVLPVNLDFTQIDSLGCTRPCQLLDADSPHLL